MTKKIIKSSDVLGDNYYIYELSSSNFTPALNGTITITCTVTDVYGDPIGSKSITLYKNGTSVSTKTTNSSGVATWSVTCSAAGIQSFKVGNKAIEVFVDNKSDVGHTHSQYLTEHQSLANYVTTSDSRLSDARTPTSHTHGSITNDGKITSSTTMAGNSQYVVYADVYGTIKRADTMPSAYLRDPAAYSQIGNSAGDSQYTINGKINTALAGKADLNHTHNQYLTSHQSLDSKTVTVEKLATAESGYLSSYAVKQNGVQVGNTINIPKDFLVKSGSVKTVSTTNNPVSGYSVGDKYIDLVINVQEGTSTDSHIYILVSDLVDTPITISDVTNLQTTLNSKIDTAGTGLSKSGTTLNHSNSITALTTASFKKIKYDAQGHITGTADVAASDLPSHTHSQYLTSHQDISGKENTSNKVTSISSSSTDTQYPSAKLVYDQLNNKAPTSHASTATTYGVSNASNYGHSMASSTNPKMDGTATVGSETAKFARGDHIHPTDTSRAPTSHASTANTYGLGSTSNYGHVKTINNLTQSSHSDGTALSAYQGKVLNDTKADKSQVVDWDNIVFVDKTDDATGSIILNFLA